MNKILSPGLSFDHVTHPDWRPASEPVCRLAIQKILAGRTSAFLRIPAARSPQSAIHNVGARHLFRWEAGLAASSVKRYSRIDERRGRRRRTFKGAQSPAGPCRFCNTESFRVDPLTSAFGRLQSFACPDSTGSLRSIAAARRSAAWVACVDDGGPCAAHTQTLISGLCRTCSESSDGLRLIR